MATPTNLGTLGTTVPSKQAGISNTFQTVLLNGVVGHPEISPLALGVNASYAAATEWDYSFQISSGNTEQNSHDWMLLLNNDGSFGHTLYGLQVNVTTNSGPDQETWPDGDDYRPEYPENAPQHYEGDSSLSGGPNVTQYFEVTNPNVYVNFEMALIVAPDPYWYGAHYGSNTTAATAKPLGVISSTSQTTNDVFETLYDRSLVTTGASPPSVNINVSSPIVQIQQHFYNFTVNAAGNVTISQTGLSSGDMVLSGGSLSGFQPVQSGQAMHLGAGNYVIETVDSLTTLSSGQNVVAFRPPGEDFQAYSFRIAYVADTGGGGTAGAGNGGTTGGGNSGGTTGGGGGGSTRTSKSDVNADGISDVVLQNGGTVVDWTMTDGLYSTGNILTTGATGFTIVGTGDFNGDGTADVLLQNSGTVVDWILKNGAYQTGNVLTTGGAGFTVVGTGDFNNDGTSDVLLQNGGTVVDWIIKNGQYLSGNVLTSGATGYSVVGTGDFNGDGTSDVLLQNGGTVVDWIMQSGKYQSGNVPTTAASGFTVVGTGDFNGDGTSDVLLQNGGTVVDWIMKNGAYQSGNVLTTAATGFTVVGTGDYNGDGTSDVLLQNGGNVVDWIMKNGTYQSGAVVTTGASGFMVSPS